MLTQLITVKTRLALDEFNVQYDSLLTNAIKAISARFDKETNRTLARTVGATHEFPADDTEILVPCYPIETVSKFESKTTEAEGWVAQTGVEYLIRGSCRISLSDPIIHPPSSIIPALARLTYTGGYVVPGATPSPGQTSLPSDIEQAAVEQVAYWFQTRDKLGLNTIWPHTGTYEKFAQLDLLNLVVANLKPYQRWTP